MKIEEPTNVVYVIGRLNTFGHIVHVHLSTVFNEEANHVVLTQGGGQSFAEARYRALVGFEVLFPSLWSKYRLDETKAVQFVELEEKPWYDFSIATAMHTLVSAVNVSGCVNFIPNIPSKLLFVSSPAKLHSVQVGRTTYSRGEFVPPIKPGELLRLQFNPKDHGTAVTCQFLRPVE